MLNQHVTVQSNPQFDKTRKLLLHWFMNRDGLMPPNCTYDIYNPLLPFHNTVGFVRLSHHTKDFNLRQRCGEGTDKLLYSYLPPQYTHSKLYVPATTTFVSHNRLKNTKLAEQLHTQ